jgi:hypothetical protein
LPYKVEIAIFWTNTVWIRSGPFPKSFLRSFQIISLKSCIFLDTGVCPRLSRVCLSCSFKFSTKNKLHYTWRRLHCIQCICFIPVNPNNRKTITKW